MVILLHMALVKKLIPFLIIFGTIFYFIRTSSLYDTRLLLSNIDETPYLYAVVGTIFGVLAGFAIQKEWDEWNALVDAVRGEVTLGPIGLDATYADSQRSVYGSDGGPRVDYDGRFGFLGASLKAKYLTVKGFAYLLDYDPTAYINQAAVRSQLDSSQTYGFRATSHLPLSHKVALNFDGSYARQSSYENNPRHYAADYVMAEGNLAAYGFTATAGYELLGSDAHAVGGPWAVQTPMATIHSFDGFADVFLTTPARGLKDTFGGVGYVFPKTVGVPGLNAKLMYRQFDSDLGNLNYGHEWDASLGFKTGCVKWLVQYADYTAVGAAAVGAGTTTKKFWLQTVGVC